MRLNYRLRLKLNFCQPINHEAWGKSYCDAMRYSELNAIILFLLGQSASRIKLSVFQSIEPQEYLPTFKLNPEVSIQPKIG